MARRILQKRERLAIIGGACILLLLGLTPAARNLAQKYARTETQVTHAERRLGQVHDLRAAIEADRVGHSAIQQRLLARDPQFDLYSFMDTNLRKHDLKSRATLQSKGGLYSGRKLDDVELTLKGLSMEELVGFLHSVHESDNLIVLQNLKFLRPARGAKGLECQTTFIAPRR